MLRQGPYHVERRRYLTVEEWSMRASVHHGASEEDILRALASGEVPAQLVDGELRYLFSELSLLPTTMDLEAMAGAIPTAAATVAATTDPGVIPAAAAMVAAITGLGAIPTAAVTAATTGSGAIPAAAAMVAVTTAGGIPAVAENSEKDLGSSGGDFRSGSDSSGSGNGGRSGSVASGSGTDGGKDGRSHEPRENDTDGGKDGRSHEPPETDFDWSEAETLVPGGSPHREEP